jgi:hypothetical protein
MAKTPWHNDTENRVLKKLRDLLVEISIRRGRIADCEAFTDLKSIIQNYEQVVYKTAEIDTTNTREKDRPNDNN